MVCLHAFQLVKEECICQFTVRCEDQLERIILQNNTVQVMIVKAYTYVEGMDTVVLIFL